MDTHDVQRVCALCSIEGLEAFNATKPATHHLSDPVPDFTMIVSELLHWYQAARAW